MEFLAEFGTPENDIIYRFDLQNYEEVVNHIKKIREEASPIAKMRLLAQISTKMEDAIKQFWQDIIVISPTKLRIDGDQLIAIYLFLILKT